MKCVKGPQGDIQRLPNDEAKEKVAAGWIYCPKTEYKKLHRAPKKLAITAKPVGAAEPNVGGDSFPKKGKTSKYKQKQQSKEAKGV